MKVCFLSTEYPTGRTGGIGTSIRNLGRQLVERGHEVTVLGWGIESGDDGSGIRIESIASTGIPKAGWLLNRVAAARTINQMVRAGRIDIVETPDWCGLSAGMRLCCPVVIRCHGSATFFANILNEPIRPSLKLAERVALHGAVAVAGVSRFVAEETTRLFGLREGVSVIHNGIDTSAFVPTDVDESTPPVLFHHGTIVRKKGVIDLCRAFSSIAAAHPRAELWLVGRDAADKQTGNPSTWALCQAELSEAARKRVSYLGPRPYSEIVDLLARATICVYPSYAEALPVSWVEAMASGKPIVAYDVGWASEMVDEGRSGRLVAPGDHQALCGAILDLLVDRTQIVALGQRARNLALERFDIRTIAGQSIRWYGQVLSNVR